MLVEGQAQGDADSDNIRSAEMLFLLVANGLLCLGPSTLQTCTLVSTCHLFERIY